jgi:hypothetical protein
VEVGGKIRWPVAEVRHEAKDGATSSADHPHWLEMEASRMNNVSHVIGSHSSRSASCGRHLVDFVLSLLRRRRLHPHR